MIATMAIATTIAMIMDITRTAFRVARDFGYEDGSWVARRDIAEAKPYNPFPRGGFKHEDHGYRRE